MRQRHCHAWDLHRASASRSPPSEKPTRGCSIPPPVELRSAVSAAMTSKARFESLFIPLPRTTTCPACALASSHTVNQTIAAAQTAPPVPAAPPSRPIPLPASYSIFSPVNPLSPSLASKSFGNAFRPIVEIETDHLDQSIVHPGSSFSGWDNL